MAVEVVLRMLTMAYGVRDFYAIRKDLTNSLRRLSSHQHVDAIRLLHGCVEHIVEDVRRSKPGCKRFVLLVDEPMALVEKGIDVGAYSALRQALLDEPILDLHTSLAMTALYVGVSGATGSGRVIVTMPLPAHLDVEETYDLWLRAHLAQLENDLVDETDDTPKMSALSLWRLHRPPDETQDETPDRWGALWPLVEAVANVVSNAAELTTSDRLCESLRLLGNAAITSKLFSAQRSLQGNTYSLFKLLSVSGVTAPTSRRREVGVNDANVQFTSTAWQHDWRDLHDLPPLPGSHQDLAALVDELLFCEIRLGDVRIFDCHPQEAWDGMWMLRRADGRPFVLLAEYKFCEVSVTDNDDDGTTVDHQRRPDSRQAAYFRDTVVAACRAAVGPHAEQHAESAAAAIADGRFAFVYIDTTPAADTDAVALVFPDSENFLRLTGAAARRALTNVGTELLDVVRQSATLLQRQQARQPQPPTAPPA